MSLKLHADLPPLREADDGVVRIAGTRIPLERVLRAFLTGMTPEQIVQDFDVLTVEDVYAVVNYYLHHRSEVDAYMAGSEQAAARTRELIETEMDPAEIRNRLLSRRRMAGYDHVPAV
jgi:uncharacterized protein (DUF433 family)